MGWGWGEADREGEKDRENWKFNVLSTAHDHLRREPDKEPETARESILNCAIPPPSLPPLPIMETLVAFLRKPASTELRYPLYTDSYNAVEIILLPFLTAVD